MLQVEKLENSSSGWKIFQTARSRDERVIYRSRWFANSKLLIILDKNWIFN